VRQILLDMDGVIVDFVRGVCALHGKENPYLDGQNINEFGMDLIWGMSANAFWKDCGFDFWKSLEFTPEAASIISAVEGAVGKENVCLLTAPCSTAGCIDGKREWVRQNMPDYSKRLMVGSAKEFLAAPDRLLIDDRNENIWSYSGAGGRGFLFPRPWNESNHLQSVWEDEMKYVLGAFKSELVERCPN
jgi:5'(3')-deoxyribonucleotidase